MPVSPKNDNGDLESPNVVSPLQPNLEDVEKVHQLARGKM